MGFVGDGKVNQMVPRGDQIGMTYVTTTNTPAITSAFGNKASYPFVL
jgi:hypothetical protein